MDVLCTLLLTLCTHGFVLFVLVIERVDINIVRSSRQSLFSSFVSFRGCGRGDREFGVGPLC